MATPDDMTVKRVSGKAANNSSPSQYIARPQKTRIPLNFKEFRRYVNLDNNIWDKSKINSNALANVSHSGTVSFK